MKPEPFIPDPLPRTDIDWSRHVTLIGSANAALARFDGLLQSIQNPDLLLTPLITQEAVISSRIEGTQATMREVFIFEAGTPVSSDEKREDIREVINYQNALSYAKEQMRDRHLSWDMILHLHTLLLQGVRGRAYQGTIRDVQNYIGPIGQPIEYATYIPPPPELVPEMIQNWEEYLLGTEKDILVQLAILKGQFEVIHPFCDGNGRIGRMIVPLFLAEKGILCSPAFYISAYFDSTRDEYYTRLRNISASGDINGWISYFLTAIRDQAVQNITQAQRVVTLHEEMKSTIPQVIRSQYSIAVIDTLFLRPIFSTSDFSEKSEIPSESAKRILQKLLKAGFIELIREGKGRTPSVFQFTQLIQIAENEEQSTRNLT
jgi:Fic family protein